MTITTERQSKKLSPVSVTITAFLDGEEAIHTYSRKPKRIHAALRNTEWDTVMVQVRYDGDRAVGNEGTYTTLADAQAAVSAFTEQDLREYVSRQVSA